MATIWPMRLLLLGRVVLVAVGLVAQSEGATATDLSKAGRLVIAGGAIGSSAKEVWQVMLEGRQAGRPIGIISTASEDPQATGQPFAEALNQEWGAGSALFIPLGVAKGSEADSQIVALLSGCGGFYFTGGQQDRTVRILRNSDGQQSPALKAIWEVYRSGGIVGGSSAGAAIMSDPMITGGRSADALLHGATSAESASKSRGVGYGVGLGFHPGYLYCQHHLERGRFGRLLAALVSDALPYERGVGVAEDTAWVVDHQQQTGTVIGARGVIHADSRNAVRRADGGISGVRVHYLDRGDSIHLQTGEVIPAAGKEGVEPLKERAVPNAVEDAWSKDAIWHLLIDLAGSSENASAVARDVKFDLTFQRSATTQVWRKAVEATGERPTWTVANIVLEVTPKSTPESSAFLSLGKSHFTAGVKGKTLNVFSYRPDNYTDGPLLVVMHGLNRNAEDYRDNSIPLAQRFEALVIAPEFSLEQFPTEAYQRGGVTRDGKVQPQEEWTFQYVLEVVEQVRQREGRPDWPFYLIGHSAGGQFLNRMAAFLPGKAERIVATNPGTLIFPTRDVPFQFGFGNLPEALSDDAWLKKYLTAPLTLYLGTADTGLTNLDVTPQAMAQGATRIERGRACFARGEALARERGWPFGWRLVEAEGIGHSSADMFAHPQAKDALFGR